MAKQQVINMENGSTLIYQKQKSFNGTSFVIGFRSGCQLDGKYLGLSHLLEHLLFDGTTEDFAELYELYEDDEYLYATLTLDKDDYVTKIVASTEEDDDDDNNQRQCHEECSDELLHDISVEYCQSWQSHIISSFPVFLLHYSSMS